jgi:3-hydroxyisobutyrate dehydrogenase-like beta-hydroxyacid dehydrogenase
MGLPTAIALAAAGFDVVAFDPSQERSKLATDAGLALATSSEELAAAADVLITVLPGPIELEDALVAQGVIDQLGAGALWLDLTSGAPDVTERLAAYASDRGVATVGAPMAGGPAAAESRSVRFFVGGTPAAIERARLLLNALGGPGAIDVIGASAGSGHTAKLLANLLWFGQAVAVTEALLLGVSLGVRVDVLRRSLAASAGGSVFIEEYLDRLLAGDYLETFGIDRCVEELETLVRLAELHAVPFELSTNVARLYRDALKRFGAIDGELLAAKLLEERAGIRLSAEAEYRAMP